MSDNGWVYGVQPVLEALRGQHSVDVVWVSRAAGKATHELQQRCQKQRVQVRMVDRQELDETLGVSNHQGVAARVRLSGTATQVSDILDRAQAMAADPLVVLLDGIQDPQNLGAILRAAHAFGAHGVIIPKHRSAAVTPAVIRASAGAALHIPVVTVTNLKRAMDELKEAGVWLAATAMEGEAPFRQRLDGPLALVIGSEGKGVKPSIARQCDYVVSIPLAHGFDSLNASVASGVLLYEVMRQRYKE